jgi:hypothetical protein
VAFDAGQRLAQYLRFGAAHALREPRKRGDPVAGLVEGRQHQLGHVGLPGRGRPVPPSAAVPLPARETLLREPVKHCHHCCVSQFPLVEPVADLSYGQR